jgi:hypothetical protein
MVVPLLPHRFNSGRSHKDKVTQKKSVGVDRRWGGSQLHPELVELVSVAIGAEWHGNVYLSGGTVEPITYHCTHCFCFRSLNKVHANMGRYVRPSVLMFHLRNN